MGLEFDWQITEEDSEATENKYWATPPWMRWGGMLLIAVICLSVLGGFWWRINSAESELRNTVQPILDLEQQAIQQRDGELFFSTIDRNDLEFQSIQLRPSEQSVYSSGQTITKAELHNNIIWANLSHQEGDTTYQRIAFFETSSEGTFRRASDSAYWGAVWNTERFWGTLQNYDADHQWVEQLSETVDTVIGTQLAKQGLSSPTHKMTVFIRNDYDVSVAPNTIYYPSPRLVGLDASGQPSEAYLEGLSRVVATHFEPVTLRFALPDHLAVDGVSIFLQQAAIQFSEKFEPRQIAIEFITQEELEDQAPEDWLKKVDGALIQPTESLIKQGYLRDITQLVSDDTEFDRGDFYVQAWQGSWWRERMWLVPWSTSLNLLYYNQDLFDQNTVDLPQADWTWNQVVTALKQLTLSGVEDLPIIDPTHDLLYAHAFSNFPTCQGQNCVTPLTPALAATTLEWYRELVGEAGVFIDLATMDSIEREQTVRNTLSAHKQVAMWVDGPIRYEYQLGLQRTGILPLPGFSAEAPLAMPVRIHGHVISNYSEQPYWTWQWLKFLSYQSPPPRLRHIPARPSVARQSLYWQKLPEEIANVYQKITGGARPILIGEENYFTWQQLDHVIRSDHVTERIAQPIKTNWFLQP